MVTSGAPLFIEAHNQMPYRSGPCQVLRMGDLDGDGDDDAFCGGGLFFAWFSGEGGGRPNAVWINDGYGHFTERPGAVEPVAAADPRPHSRSGMGTLLLNPASLVQEAGGVFDRRGLSTFSTQVPNNPALVGVTHYWQALVGNSPHYTNRETTVLQGF